MQTQQEGKVSIVKHTLKIIKKQGVLALYSGLSASLLRQGTYSTTRFGVYEVIIYINNISVNKLLYYIIYFLGC